MNVLSEKRVAAIRDAFDSGLSHRAAAAHCGIPKNTIARYFNRWRSSNYGGEMSCIVKGTTKTRWKEEAIKRDMSLRELHSYVMETIAEDDLFNAVME